MRSFSALFVFMDLTDCREVNIETGVIAISYALLTLRKRDIAIAPDDRDLGQSHTPMHERFAYAAEASEISRSVRDWQIVEHVGGGARGTRHRRQKSSPGPQRCRWRRRAASRKARSSAPWISAGRRASIAERPGTEPTPDRVFVHANTTRSFLDGIASVNFDAPTIGASHRLVPHSISARISSTRHAVIRFPSFTGWENGRF